MGDADSCGSSDAFAAFGWRRAAGCQSFARLAQLCFFSNLLVDYLIALFFFAFLALPALPWQPWLSCPACLFGCLVGVVASLCACYLYPALLLACFLDSLLPCFLAASLLPCFRASLLPCFLASLLPCFLASLLPCFLAWLSLPTLSCLRVACLFVRFPVWPTSWMDGLGTFLQCLDLLACLPACLLACLLACMLFVCNGVVGGNVPCARPTCNLPVSQCLAHQGCMKEWERCFRVCNVKALLLQDGFLWRRVCPGRDGQEPWKKWRFSQGRLLWDRNPGSTETPNYMEAQQSRALFVFGQGLLLACAKKGSAC